MAKSKGLSDLTIGKIKHGAKRLEIADKTSGLYLLAQPAPSDSKSWAYRYRFGGKTRKWTIGPYPAVGIVRARKLAADAAEQVQLGKDPGAAKIAARAAEQAAKVDLFEDVAAAFLARYRGKKSEGLRDSTRHLWTAMLRIPMAKWKGRPIATITKTDVRELVEGVAKRAPVQGNRLLTLCKTCFAWARKNDYIERSPAEDVDPPSPEKSRERVLSDVELAALWRACDADFAATRFPYGRMVQLLALTGGRVDEARESTWGEFDLDNTSWLLPGRRAKNGRDHFVPLAPAAVAILQGLRRIKGCAFTFSTNGRSPIGGLSKAKKRIDDAMLAELGELTPWVLHDLRRTIASGLQRLGFPIEVVEAVLNHKSGSIRGVGAIYARHDFAAEKRAALEAWASHVEKLHLKN